MMIELPFAQTCRSHPALGSAGQAATLTGSPASLQPPVADDFWSLTALRGRALSFKEGDYQMLADPILLGALDHAYGRPSAMARPLRHSECKALEGSPMTLLRMAQLNAQQRGGHGVRAVEPTRMFDCMASCAAPLARRRVAWGQLRAAGQADAPSSFQVQSECGRWSLSGKRDAHEHWTVLLKLHDEAELDFLDAQATPSDVAVLDGEGNTLLFGCLDAYGELAGPWAYPQSPMAHLLHRHDGQAAWRVEFV